VVAVKHVDGPPMLPRLLMQIPEQFDDGCRQNAWARTGSALMGMAHGHGYGMTCSV
jgi:hypothetical protein